MNRVFQLFSLKRSRLYLFDLPMAGRNRAYRLHKIYQRRIQRGYLPDARPGTLYGYQGT